MNPWADSAAVSASGLQQLREQLGRVASMAGLVLLHGEPVLHWGDLQRRVNVHSVRKSLLHALYGIRVEAGEIDLDASLGDLDIDDHQALSATERAARLSDLLGSRSGVYHPAVYETEQMRAARPARGSHPPGTFWYYNNWDFNVLGAAYEQLGAARIYEDFAARIAGPIGMQDFRVADGGYEAGPESRYPAYPVSLSTRDMARFGQLYLQRGRWQSRQIVPAAWVELGTRPLSAGMEEGAYGWLWWAERQGWLLAGPGFDSGAFAALGTRGNAIVVIPSRHLVLVNTVDTAMPGGRMSWPEVGQLARCILEAIRSA